MRALAKLYMIDCRYAMSLEKLLGFTYNVHLVRSDEFSVGEFDRQDA